MMMARTYFFFLFFLCASLFLMMPLSASLRNITTDETTLIALKHHLLTTNPNHSIAQNWFTTNSSSSSSICDWVGVICGSRHRRVTQLNLSNMGITATIPAFLLGNLSFLNTLDLSNNNFHGNLPLDLGSLPRLKVLVLRNNTFTGFIPPSFSNISQLQRLSISYNQLQGSLPQSIANLTNLKIFGASFNNFGGAIPTGIGNLRLLESCSLGNNGFQEYGSEGLVSIACDVYSYGIILMETFTRRRPSDDMFGGELSLRNWINLNSTIQVVDSKLMEEKEEHLITEEMKCISSILALAMDCTAESPKDRKNIKDVSVALKKIKLHLISTLE